MEFDGERFGRTEPRARLPRSGESAAAQSLLTSGKVAGKVNYMVHYNAPPAHLDAVFGALSDPTRRAVVSSLRRGERTVGELAEPFGMSLTGFIKHLGILEDAGLIARSKVGRTVSCRLQEGALRGALDWLDRHEKFWNARLDRLGTYLDRKESDTWTSQPKTKPASGSGGSTRTPSPPSTRRGRTRRK